MIQFQEYFQSDYPGFASFIDIIIKPIFGDSFKEVDYIDDMIDCLNDDPDELECYDEIEKSDENLKKLAKESGLQRILKLGTIKVQGGIRPIYVYDITVSKRRLLSRNRKGIQQLISRTLSNQSGAFMLFHYEDAKWEWRFSYKFVGKDQNDSTNSKRFTYLFGKNQVCKTAAQRFTKLLNKKCEIAIDDITDAFSVEALSKEFFDTYKAHYEHFCQFVYDNKRDSNYFGEEFSRWEDKTIRDYVKKLLGRIVFLHFLQKKGWMGVPVDKQWGEGDLKFMMNLFDSCRSEQKANYLDDVLEPMFEDLNNQRIDDIAGEWSNAYIIAEENSGIKIPYLNGGLFEREPTDLPKSVFPADYFADLFDFFNQYNFTIDENDPNDAEVGIDPEMLGRIFENLLEDNKDKGAFYTPKEIVQYMCRESLIAYLQTDVEEDVKESYRQFVTTHEVNELRPADVFKVDKKLREVKICDPAIGSGAFPMGLLKELFNCRMAIEGLDEGKSPAEIKKDIIQNSIYGVDIEKGAVDIARLRFWLSLIIDEQTPNALPNMDFKIMRGNSLLEQYNGFDLGTIMNSKKKVEGPVQMTLFEDNVDVLRRQVIGLRREYFRETDKDKKKNLRQRMREIVQQQINTLSYNIDLSGIDIADNSEFFLWHTWFSDVFENGGFDIVIGNPPYINVQLMSDAEKQLYRELYTSFFKRCDMFCLFMELGLLNLSAEKGVVTLIIPSVVHSNMSYKKIRDVILNHQWLQEVHYTGGDVFNAPTVDTTILICNKGGSQKITLTNAVDFTHPKSHKVPADYFCKYNNVISVGDDQGSGIFDKLFNPQYDIVDQHYNVFQGIVTGNNPAFIFDTENEAFEKGIDSLLLHPLCHGRDIEKYKVRSRERRIIYIDNNVKIDDYPKTKEWLLQFKDALDTRREVKRGVINWCCLQWPRVKSELDSTEKLIIQNTRNESLKIRMVATLDDCSVYGTQGINFIIPKQNEGSLRFLLGILNSKLINYLFATKFLNLAIKAEYVKQIRIPNASDKNKTQIENLVNQVLKGKQNDCDTSALEQEIDSLVYQLYGLTEEEIQIVEGQ